MVQTILKESMVCASVAGRDGRAAGGGMMQLEPHAAVRTEDGTEAGRLKRVVRFGIHRRGSHPAKDPSSGGRIGSAARAPETGGLPERRLVKEVMRNVPQGTMALKKGAKVVAADGRKVGKVEQGLTDPKTCQATELTIVQGFLSKKRRRIPMSWVQRVTESEVDLDVGPGTVEQARIVSR